MLLFLFFLAIPLASTASNDTLVWCHQTVSGWAWSEAEAVAMLENEDYLRVTDVAVLQHRRIKRRSVVVGQDAHDDEPLYFHLQGRQAPTGPATSTSTGPTASAPSPQSDTVVFHLLLLGLFVCMASLTGIFWFCITAYLENQLEDKQYLLLLEEEYNQKQALMAVMEMEQLMENNTTTQEPFNDQPSQGQADLGHYGTQAAQHHYNSHINEWSFYNQVDPGQSQVPFGAPGNQWPYSNNDQDTSQLGQESFGVQTNQGQYDSQIQGNMVEFTSNDMLEDENTESTEQLTGEDLTGASAPEMSSSPVSTSTPRAVSMRSTTTLGPGERKINPLFLKGLSSEVFVDGNRRSDEDVNSNIIVIRQFPPFKNYHHYPASGVIYIVPSPSVPSKYSFRVSVTLVNGESCDSRSSCSVYSSLWSTNTAKEANLKADAPVQCTFQCQTENCYQPGKK